MEIDRRAILVAIGGAGVAVAATRTPLLLPAQAAAPVRRDLYACEGCEATFERSPVGMPATATIAGPTEPGERITLTGRLLRADGSGPAPGVVVYVHHTNIDGLYANGTNETEWSRRNGRLRGWVKSDADGRYTFHSIKPAPYPDHTDPAHFHLMIGEPGQRAYYVDNVVFAGEFKVDDTYLRRQELRGGSGVVRLGRTDKGELLAQRDIVLERHPV